MATHKTDQTAVCQDRIDHPEWTMVQIANQHGVTRERIRQILSKAGLPTRKAKETKYCLHCGAPFQTTRRNQGKYCQPSCGWDRKRTAVRVQVNCAECGEEFTRRQTAINASLRLNKRVGAATRQMWCSRRCHGVWFGREHGVKKGDPSRGKLTTECRRGHQWTEENTYKPPSGYRHCRACAQLRYELKKERNK